ncbi:YybH family protein [Sphingomicrobium arenosum]|uniref:YybH family protein n=1 Tax=Sphingomicrobium arenosum TaxID=2233861 RepID=UPI002240FE20|nr:DUF4440 domain-containing protein [Sphingomicrobium arenosum]
MTPFALAAALFAAAHPATPAPAPAAPVGCVGEDMEAAQECAAIAAAARAFSAAYVAGDVEALLDLYTLDGVAMAGGRDPLVGREALARFWQPNEAVAVVAHETVSDALELRGPAIAIDRGIYRGTTRRVESGEEASWGGRYLIVWEKGADGKWRMAEDMWAAFER